MAVLIGGISGVSKINTITSNQYYKGLNNRYDNRFKKLRKLGFKLHREFMVWYIKDPITNIDIKMGRGISNEFVYHADKRSFEDKIKRMINK